MQSKTARFVSEKKLEVGEIAPMGGSLWRIVRKQEIPDRRFPWMYYAEAL